ncbi:hypothetical protein L9F63_022680 [Diploptera punctata]|uniref:aralkylamine N-acetyltransferase n=1 Tax=Diploptera punctata TaxID=6984 RepID=A0AAD7ZMB5_DIPPU|nr:hypothetical protein L9F63_022680 [Diploptera punctata]
MDEEYDIVPATEGDTERIAEFLRQTFFKYEPMNIGFKAPPNRPTEAMLFLKYLKEGTSLIAITKSGLMIGLVINEARTKTSEARIPRARGLEVFHESYTKIANFVDRVENSADLWKITGVETALFLTILAVDPIASGRGIGKKLVKKSIEVAKSKGFPSLWIMCSSHYSAKICRSLGMQCVYRLPYKDNKNEAGEPEFLPPAPHTEANIFVMKIAKDG